MIVQDQLKTVDGVEHLHSNLFRVKLNQIQFAENGDGESGSFTFRNPRHILGTNKPKGFSKEEMAELRETLRTEGLKDALRLRWIEVDGKVVLQVVDGERRSRCLQKLVKDNAECFDPSDETMKPAKKLYEYVDCRINNMDDATAFKAAFSGNDRAVPIGDGATIALIREFRNAGWTDDQILETTGKSITWLKDTDTLIGLDEQTFTALTAEQINRSVALELAKIEDVEHRMTVLGCARDIATARLANVKKRLEKEVEAAEDRAEEEEAAAVVAELEGDEEGKETATATAAKLKKTAKKKKQAKDELEPKVNSKDLRKAKNAASKGGTSSAGTGGGSVALTRKKIEKHYYLPAKQLIKDEGLDNDGEPYEIDLEDAWLVKLICESIDKGETDILKILSRHLKAKEKRAA